MNHKKKNVTVSNSAQQWMQVSEDQLLRMVCGGWDNDPANRNLPALKTFAERLQCSIQHLNNCMGQNPRKVAHIGFVNWMRLYALTKDKRIVQWHEAQRALSTNQS